jgi:diadenosine tetraphosphate (Ap4A) HIT family hydrolase
MEDYSHLTVKDYKFWSVQVHQNQSYLGRCVIWCIREDAEDLADANPGEQEELFKVLQDVRKAAMKAFGAEWFNYSFLGNETRHLHGHFIPRYSSPQVFEDVTFTDEQWGKNPHKGEKKDFIASPELLESIRLKLKESLG